MNQCRRDGANCEDHTWVCGSRGEGGDWPTTIGMLSPALGLKAVRGLRLRRSERWTMCSRHALRPSNVSPHLHVYFAVFGFSKPSLDTSWQRAVILGRFGAA